MRRSLRICRPKKNIILFVYLFFCFYFVGVAEFAIFLISQQARSRSQICWIRQISVMISKIHAIENSALFRVCVCGHECEYDKVVTTDRDRVRIDGHKIPEIIQ